MVFDVPKVVRSPECDHGYDEESRKGRDMNIDILEAYVWISEVFQVKSGFYRSTGGLPKPPGGLMGLHGPRGRRGKEAGGGRAPLPFPSLNRTRERGRRPPFPSPLPPLSPPSRSRKGGFLLLLGGGLLLLARLSLAGRPLPLAPLYTGAGGHPRTHKLIFMIVP